MSDLPERIWVWKSHEGTIHVANLLPINDTDTEYLRADLAPTVGFSREQMEEAWTYGYARCMYDEGSRKHEAPQKYAYLATLTPAAQPLCPECGGTWINDNGGLCDNGFHIWENRPAPNPSVLVEALERIANHFGRFDYAEMARTALAEYRKGGRE